MISFVGPFLRCPSARSSILCVHLVWSFAVFRHMPSNLFLHKRKLPPRTLVLVLFLLGRVFPFDGVYQHAA